MNQIIFTSNNSPENYKFEKDKRKIFKYKFIQYFCVFIIIICIIIFIINRYDSYKKEKISKALMNNFSITRLYAETNNLNSNILNNTIAEDDPFVIGLIKVEKIDIMYPILSETTEELLKIAPCRFYGPMPNEVRKFMHSRAQLCK